MRIIRVHQRKNILCRILVFIADVPVIGFWIRMGHCQMIIFALILNRYQPAQCWNSNRKNCCWIGSELDNSVDSIFPDFSAGHFGSHRPFDSTQFDATSLVRQDCRVRWPIHIFPQPSQNSPRNYLPVVQMFYPICRASWCIFQFRHSWMEDEWLGAEHSTAADPSEQCPTRTRSCFFGFLPPSIQEPTRRPIWRDWRRRLQHLWKWRKATEHQRAVQPWKPFG